MSSHVKSVRFISGFVFGSVFSTGSCLVALKLYKHEEEKAESASSTTHQLIERVGLPQTGADVRFYFNHILSYDQTHRTPRWVTEHLSDQRLLGKADRKHCRFKPDPNIPELFTARNEDYLRSGWSRGHMAPAGDNKISEQAMAETFYLSNIVPQNYENNAGFWNRLEMFCRDLTQKFGDVWVVSGPLMLPRVDENGRKTVSYQLIGEDNVAVPTHLYKVVLVQRDSSEDSRALGAFVVPNSPIGFDRHLTEFQRFSQCGLFQCSFTGEKHRKARVETDSKGKTASGCYLETLTVSNLHILLMKLVERMNSSEHSVSHQVSLRCFEMT
ncbi:nuclease EXOG, mitochondrial-like isoform X2 [Triplophysa rosa]|uniref:nuclease EXOG, mitochondrial-like isoform X2 n=1 Tax=Triplophysa rosa TaxID=992332 RepID=UPI0025461898|nr:nuclease EXOG, mitochondrial-like isoform X2 [Triplophysa rosa]